MSPDAVAQRMAPSARLSTSTGAPPCSASAMSTRPAKLLPALVDTRAAVAAFAAIVGATHRNVATSTLIVFNLLTSSSIGVSANDKGRAAPHSSPAVIYGRTAVEHYSTVLWSS